MAQLLSGPLNNVEIQATLSDLASFDVRDIKMDVHRQCTIDGCRSPAAADVAAGYRYARHPLAPPSRKARYIFGVTPNALNAHLHTLICLCPAAIDEGGPVNLQPVRRPDAGIPHMLPFGDDSVKVPWQAHNLARPIMQSCQGRVVQHSMLQLCDGSSGT